MRAHIITVPTRAASAAVVFRGLALVPFIDSVTILTDHEYKGPWWNTSRALKAIVASGEPSIIVQDDVTIRAAALKTHLPTLEKHLFTYGLISMFAPPQKKFDLMAAEGIDGCVGYEFLWAQMYMVSPEFAQATIATDQHLNGKVGRHDEVRYRVAAQKTETPILTLAKSFCEHDLRVKSTMGTSPMIGKTVRNTRNLMTEEGNLTNLNLTNASYSKKDLKEYHYAY